MCSIEPHNRKITKRATWFIKLTSTKCIIKKEKSGPEEGGIIVMFGRMFKTEVPRFSPAPDS